MIAGEMRPAIEYAIEDLQEFDELDRLQLPSLRKASYTEEQILGDWFPDEPRG